MLSGDRDAPRNKQRDSLLLLAVAEMIRALTDLT